MDYAPEKNNIRILISVGLLLLDLIIIALFMTSGSMSVKGLLIFLFLILNLYGVYFLLLLMTLRFRLTEKEFIISGAFNLKKIRIPVGEIQSWSRRITLLENTGTSLHTARFALGKGMDANGDSADLFITSSKKAIFIRTKQGNFGISPEAADDFTAQLREMGILQQVGSERSYMKTSGNDGRGSLNQLTLYCILLTAFLLLLPVIMYFLKLLPDWVPLSLNQFITRSAYLESVFTRGLVILLLIITSYGIVILLSASQGRYYFRIMLAPLVGVILLLFLEINTHLNILINF